MSRRKSKHSPVFIVSVAAHLVVGGVLAMIPQDKLREVVAIALSEAPEKDQKKPEPPKPQPHHERPAANARRSMRPAAPRVAPAAPAAQVPVFTDIGLALDSSSADGLAMNIAAPPAQAAPPPPKPALVAAKPKVLLAHRAEVTCTEAVIKPRPLSMVRPSYTDDARRAHIEGRVRVELSIDERGEVTAARALSGLGYGLDEAAIEALRRIRFAPATRCARAIASSLVIGMRFALGT